MPPTTDLVKLITSTLAAKEHRLTYLDSSDITKHKHPSIKFSLILQSQFVVQVSNLRGISQPSSIPVSEIRETSSPFARPRREDQHYRSSKPTPTLPLSFPRPMSTLLWPSSSSITLRGPTAPLLGDHSSSFALCLCLLLFFIDFPPIDLAGRRSSSFSRPHRLLQTPASSSSTADHDCLLSSPSEVPTIV